MQPVFCQSAPAGIRSSLTQLVTTTPEHVIENICSEVQELHLQPGDYLPTANVQEQHGINHFYHLNSGLVRIFQLAEDGREFNVCFPHEGRIFTCQDLDHNSQFYVQALEATSISKIISVEKFRQYAEQNIHYARLSMSYLRQELEYRQQRELVLQQGSALDRYAHIYHSLPANLMKRIPQYHLATYLGLNCITLSRAKKKFFESV